MDFDIDESVYAKLHSIEIMLNDRQLTAFLSEEKDKVLPIRLSEVRNALYKLQLEVYRWRAKNEKS